MIDAIANGNCVEHLEYLLRFLAAWKERPACLTPMAYQWCSAFSGMITGLGKSTYRVSYVITRPDPTLKFENGFTDVGPGCDLVHRTYRCRRVLNLYDSQDLLLKTLEIGFRLARPGRDLPAIRLDHTSDRDRMFEVAFSSGRDEVFADATYAWLADSDCTSTSSLARYFADRVEQPKPFSQKLRQAGIDAICYTWNSELTVPEPETVRLLNHLEADVDEMKEKYGWINLSVSVIRSPTGFGSLSSHNWRLLDKLTSTTRFYGYHIERDMEVMRSLEKAEDWEKLEVWMWIVWMSLPESGPRGLMEDAPTRESMEDIEQVTLELSLRRPSALQRFKNLCEKYTGWWDYDDKLQGICKQARAEQLPLDPPPYVSNSPAQGLFVLIPHFFPSVNRFTPSH